MKVQILKSLEKIIWDVKKRIKVAEMFMWLHIYIITLNLYLHGKEKLFAIPSNLQDTFYNVIAKNGRTYRGQVVHPKPLTPQGQPATKPETHLQNSLVRNVNLIQGSSIAMSALGQRHPRDYYYRIIGMIYV